VIDIETRPNPRILEDAEHWARAKEELVPPGNYKDPMKIESWKTEQIEKAREKTALTPWTGVVAAVGLMQVGSLNEKVFTAPSFDEGGELELLTMLASSYDFSACSFVGWNIRRFDVPFLIGRCAVREVELLGLPVPKNYHRVVDLYELLDGRLEDWMVAFGGSPKGVSGSAVLHLSADELAEHCRQDVLWTNRIAVTTQFVWGRR